MRYVTAGESHGQAILVIVSGVPAGLEIAQADLDRELVRRQVGYGRGGRMEIERDSAHVLSGVRHGRTLGSPIAVSIENADAANWVAEMSAFGPEAGTPVSAPRPGHADLPGVLKTGAKDVRDVLERASARETAGRVVAGAVAKRLLARVGVEVRSAVTAIGSVGLTPDAGIEAFDAAAIEGSDVRCPDEAVAAGMREAIDAARDAGESLGGHFVVWATGVVPGVGGYASAADRLDGRLAGAVMSIPAIKGVELGDGFSTARRLGSEVHDEIVVKDGRISRKTNRAGGVEGGMTNGETIVVRAAMKPIPTLMKPLASIDLTTRTPVDAAKERSDVCAVPAAAVVAEAEVAFVLCAAYLEKFGSDSVDDLLTAVSAYRSRIDW